MFDFFLGGLVAALLLVYLVYALVRADLFQRLQGLLPFNPRHWLMS